ncbi:hypothetical protein DYB31_014651 [Aphanomyces astaci]|uniref:Peptidase S1 domain-containing protein n=1 Tax=Aphanomyces astaci TaxID=112090 RepID=A0A397EAC0_APHAT|nr:hypothetical protein DYB31_014651 [Aphanomyces astaci]
MKFALLLALTVAVAAWAQDQIVPPKVAWGNEAPEDAAHCLNKGRNFAVVGTHYLTGFADGELANVTQEIKHPNGSDVGIVILDRNITSIQPVPVSFEFVPADVLTWVRGWGYVKSGGPQSPVLKELSVTTWDNTRTSAALFFLRLSDTTLGAGGVKGEDSCNGDSGGR